MELVKHLDEKIFSTSGEICEFAKKDLVFVIHLKGWFIHYIDQAYLIKKQRLFVQKLKKSQKTTEKVYCMDAVH